VTFNARNFDHRPGLRWENFIALGVWLGYCLLLYAGLQAWVH